MLEGMQNMDWICLGCCGICNFSLCRRHKRWFLIGAAYKKVAISVIIPCAYSPIAVLISWIKYNVSGYFFLFTIFFHICNPSRDGERPG